MPPPPAPIRLFRDRVGNLTTRARLEPVEVDCAGSTRQGRASRAHRSESEGIRPQNSLDVFAGPRVATSAPVPANAHRWRRMSTRAMEPPGEAKSRGAPLHAHGGARRAPNTVVIT